MADFVQIKELPRIKADYYIPLGEACRPAYWLQKHGLRRCALPFDWMMAYTLETVFKTLAEGVGRWFAEYDEDLLWQGNMRKVEDRNTRMVSLHHFSRDRSVEEQKADVLKTFQRRCERMRRILSEGKTVCLVCNRTESRKALVSFAKKLASAFPRTHFILVNVRHSESNFTVRYGSIFRRLFFYEVCGNDSHEKGATPENPLFWLGSERLWNEVCKKLASKPAKHKRVFYFFGIKITL